MFRDLIQKATNRAQVLAEVFAFLRERKAYWLIPLVVVLAAAAFLFFIATQPAVTPFVYTLF